MAENYIQYAGGHQKESIDEKDIAEAITHIQLIDGEHGAFWVSVITDEENIIEVNKDLLLTVFFEGQEIKYKATDWNEVADFYKLLLLEKFDEITRKLNAV
jgi:hypothetical protein